MAEECPFCRSLVTPSLDAQGAKVCPACRNTGTPAAPAPAWTPGMPAPGAAATAPSWEGPWGAGPAWQLGQPGTDWNPAAPWGHPTPMPQRNAPGAVASLVMGILAFVTWVFGFIFCILALVFGYKAKRHIAASGGQLGGAGVAQAGRVLGWIYVPIATILLFAMVVTLATRLGPEGATLTNEGLEIPPGDAWLQGFPVGDGATYSFSVTSTNGRPVSASLRRVDDWMDPDIVPGDALWRQSGVSVGTTYTFGPGDYALVMACEEAQPCRVQYTVRRQPSA